MCFDPRGPAPQGGGISPPPSSGQRAAGAHACAADARFPTVVRFEGELGRAPGRPSGLPGVGDEDTGRAFRDALPTAEAGGAEPGFVHSTGRPDRGASARVNRCVPVNSREMRTPSCGAVSSRNSPAPPDVRRNCRTRFQIARRCSISSRVSLRTFSAFELGPRGINRRIVAVFLRIPPSRSDRRASRSSPMPRRVFVRPPRHGTFPRHSRRRKRFTTRPGCAAPPRRIEWRRGYPAENRA